jgi:hypothetical protein
MNDRPTAHELIDAVRLYLEKELLPALSDSRQRFQTLVAANVLAIASRELPNEEALLAEELVLLGNPPDSGLPLQERRSIVRALNETLCARIRAGEFDSLERWNEVASVLRQLVVRKLEVANPRYLNEPRTQ